jgi:rod shape-determining protein MreD
MLSFLQSLSIVLLATVMVALQTLSARYLPNAAVLLNLPLIVLLYVTLTQASWLWILFLGTLVGFLQDSQTTSLLGLNGFSNIAVCSLLYYSSALISIEGWATRFCILGLSFISSRLISWGLRISFLDRHESLDWEPLLLGAVTCALVGLLLFSFFDTMFKGRDLLINVTKGLLRR